MAAIITVVVISVVALLAVKSLSLIGIDTLTAGYNTAKAGEALALADGCAEDGLLRWQLNPNYSATDADISLGNGRCNITASGSSTEIIINAVGQVDDFYKSVEIRAVRASGTPIMIESWEETGG